MVLQKHDLKFFDILNLDLFLDPKSQNFLFFQNFAVFQICVQKNHRKNQNHKKNVQSVFEESYEDGLYKYIDNSD